MGPLVGRADSGGTRLPPSGARVYDTTDTMGAHSEDASEDEMHGIAEAKAGKPGIVKRGGLNGAALQGGNPRLCPVVLG